MATNLRLRSEQEAALRRESEHTGRSQQELIREAIDRYLGVATNSPAAGSLDALVARGVLIPARDAYRPPHRRLALSSGESSLDLLDRDDRL